jgi:hypothetical protein
MKKLTVLTGLILSAWAGAKVCEQAYHLQDAYQYTLTGNSLAGLAPAGSSLKLTKSMANATLLHDSTEYRMITDWDGVGTCATWVKKEVAFAYRKRAEKTWSEQKTNEYSIKINDGEFTWKKPGWDEYWFGFASSVRGDTIALYDAVGKFKKDTRLSMWYGNATMKRSMFSATGASKGTATHFYPELTSHPDSASLTKVLLDTWKAYIHSDTQHVDFTVQLIKITYDSLPSPASRILASKAKASGFQATQNGNMVLIQPGDKKAATGEALSLYGMMGNKVATLHPTGYVYQWNGKTSAGADASTGVYFVQSGNRILGKFFYTR